MHRLPTWRAERDARVAAAPQPAIANVQSGMIEELAATITKLSDDAFGDIRELSAESTETRSVLASMLAPFSMMLSFFNPDEDDQFVVRPGSPLDKLRNHFNDRITVLEADVTTTKARLASLEAGTAAGLLGLSAAVLAGWNMDGATAASALDQVTRVGEALANRTLETP